MRMLVADHLRDEVSQHNLGQMDHICDALMGASIPLLFVSTRNNSGARKKFQFSAAFKLNTAAIRES